MIIFFIAGLLLGAVSVIFALQNMTVITVNFFSWQLSGSLALILLLALISGALVAVLFLIPEFTSSYFRQRNLRKENKKLEEELQKQKELVVFARHVPPTPEEISKIEHGSISDNSVQ